MKKLLLIFILLFLPLNVNAALEFNGTTQYIDLPSLESDIENDYQGTISAWVKRNEIDSSHTIFIHSNISLYYKYSFWQIRSTNKIRFWWRDATDGVFGDNYVYVEGDTILNAGEWYYLTVTSDGSEYKLYVNGESESLGGSGNNLGKWFADLSNADYSDFIGRYKTSSADLNYFDGLISDIRIYNRALSEAEIKTIYNAKGSDNITTGLVGRWLMNEKPDGETATVASSVIDISKEGNHGTPINSPTYRASALKTKKLIIHH